MPRNYFHCKQCGKLYFTYKTKSEYCSLDCKKLARDGLKYNCDYCGKEFKITPSRLQKHLDGEVKHLYCSKECVTKGQTKKVINVCEWCGKEYEICNAFKDVQKFCSVDCYRAYGHRPNYCKYCGEPFDASRRRELMYCSEKCKIADMYPSKIKCFCDYCNAPLELTPSVFESSKHHYCSKDCRYNDIVWSEEDKAILREWYGKKTNYEISKMLSKDYSAGAVKGAATRYGIKIREHWSDEDREYVVGHYENTPFEEIKKHLPNRSESSIIGIAHQYGLKSFAYYNSVWNESDEDLLREIYPVTNTHIVAERLHRSESAIVQHANILGIFKDSQIGECYTTLSKYIRGQNAAYHLRKLKENNFTCQITGRERDVVLHHIYGFNLILSEAMELSGVPYKRSFLEYSVEELGKVYDIFAELQDEYDSTICIHKEVHTAFHNEYGYGNNTPSQWKEFINKYYNN